jgi:hypothetical protein
MANNREAQADSRQPTVYQIRVETHLGTQWVDWFEGLAITLEANGETLLTGPVVDQAVLHSLLRKVRDLGLLLVSVVRLEPEQEDSGTLRAHETGKGSRS